MNATIMTVNVMAHFCEAGITGASGAGVVMGAGLDVPVERLRLPYASTVRCGAVWFLLEVAAAPLAVE
jgi:hypothetical protein